MSYYLIKQWHPHKGQTAESPSCIFGTGSYIAPIPLANVNPAFCYKSRKRAENVAMKNTSLYSRCEVIEVRESELRK